MLSACHYAKCHCAECYCAEVCVLFTIMLSEKAEFVAPYD
jgi:hypothetical protein